MIETMGEKRALDFFLDLTSLKIMLVLYRDNPDVPFEVLKKELNVDGEELSKKLADLIKFDLIKVKEQNGVRLFTLSKTARMSFNRLEIKKMIN
jgi:RIO-like serine/threonine protein kinase